MIETLHITPRKWHEATKKPVKVYKNGEFFGEFTSVKECAEAIGRERTLVGSYIRKGKTLGEYTFETGGNNENRNEF